MSFCTEIVCDGCCDCITIGKICTESQMIHNARANNWSIGKYHLCPECKKK